MNNPVISRKQWFLLVEEHAQSNLTQKEFCKEKDLSLVRFGYYAQRYRKQNVNKELLQPSTFSEVFVQSKPNSITHEIKIELPNGFRCNVSSAIQADHLKKILGAILSC